MHEKIRLLSSAIRTRKQGNILWRNNSNDDKYQQQISELKEEISTRS